MSPYILWQSPAGKTLLVGVAETGKAHPATIALCRTTRMVGVYESGSEVSHTGCVAHIPVDGLQATLEAETDLLDS